MSGHIKITDEVLGAALNAVTSARSAFETAGPVSDTVGSATGYGPLEHELDLFAGNWRITRGKLVSSMRALESNIRLAEEKLERWDHDSMKEGQGSGSSAATASPAPASSGGGGSSRAKAGARGGGGDLGQGIGTSDPDRTSSGARDRVVPDPQPTVPTPGHNPGERIIVSDPPVSGVPGFRPGDPVSEDPTPTGPGDSGESGDSDASGASAGSTAAGVGAAAGAGVLAGGIGSTLRGSRGSRASGSTGAGSSAGGALPAGGGGLAGLGGPASRSASGEGLGPAAHHDRDLDLPDLTSTVSETDLGGAGEVDADVRDTSGSGGGMGAAAPLLGGAALAGGGAGGVAMHHKFTAGSTEPPEPPRADSDRVKRARASLEELRRRRSEQYHTQGDTEDEDLR